MKDKRFTLIVLRHGNTFEANQVATQVGCKTDLPLTEKGLSQAQHFTTLLQQKGLSPNRIYCGALQRQSKTANIIKAAFPDAALFEKQPSLDEIDYGAWEGLTTDQIKAQWANEYENWVAQAQWPNSLFGASLSKHTQALNQWLTEMAQAVPDNGLIVAVSSNGIIRLMLQWLPQLWDNLVKEKKMESYKVGTGNYCEFSFEGLIPSVQAWNVKPGS